MPVLYFYDAATDSWKPITTGSGGGTPGPKGDKGDPGEPGESVAVSVQDTQPAAAKAGDVWISNNP
jgi:hypothetical protein